MSVSSADMSGSRALELAYKSFTQIKKNKGPRIDPCRKPHLMFK